MQFLFSNYFKIQNKLFKKNIHNEIKKSKYFSCILVVMFRKISSSKIVWCERYKNEKLFVREKKELAQILVQYIQCR
jgi:hypothetical protein